MGLQKGTKIKILLSNVLPHNIVIVQPWLKKNAISRQLAKKYVTSGWLKKIGQGAFIKAGDSVSWTGGLFALQKQLNLAIHVGARTALEIQGYGHHTSLGDKKIIYLFDHNRKAVRIPKWFKNAFAKETVINYAHRSLFTENTLGLMEYDFGLYKITLSTRERAILETLSLMPYQLSYEDAYHLVESLDTLRPKLLQQLLETCRSIKVKRLFLHLSDKFEFNWFQKLKIENLSLGKGIRSMGKNSSYDKKYKIAVSKLFYKKC